MKLLTTFAIAIALVLPVASHAKPWHYTMLHNFCTQGDCADGNFPAAGLVADAKGNLFGVTETGGAHDNGVLFELERHRAEYTFKILHDFCFSCEDASFPIASPIADIRGNIYGVSVGGGAHDCGTVFRFSPAKNKLKVLHDFCTQDGDGNSVDSALSYAGKNAGALYDGVSPLFGTTASGGANGHGTAFSLTPSGVSWTLSTLYAFCAQASCGDGEEPSGEVLVDDAGNLFGNAGTANSGGVVYELSPAAGGGPMTEAIIHTFCTNCSDGEGPVGALVLTSAGEIMGTTENANGSEGGAIFKLTPNGGGWDENVVHVFCAGNCKDGYAPSGGLILDSRGNVYGMNALGGTGENGVGGGTAYRFNGTKLVKLYDFCSEPSCGDGRVPMGMLTKDHGNLFGVTSQGGPVTAAGTVFELHP